jgi:hypothetical protein
MENAEESRNLELVKELTEKLRGLTYSNAIQTLEYVKRNLERSLTLN